MGARFKFTGFLLALIFAASASAQQQQMQIQFAEKVNIAAAAGHTEFDAYGRRFSLTLINNDRLLKAMPAARKIALGSVQLLRGSVDNAPGSWVRIARVGKGLQGAIWDGHDLYVVTSHSSIAGFLVNPLGASADQTVIYRLSDTINGLPAEFCGLSAHELPSSKLTDVNALKQYQAMVSDLEVAAAAGPSDQIEISLVGDTPFQSLMGNSATDVMLARLNMVDGIFSEQVHVLIVPVDLRLLPSGNSLTSNNPETLLDQFADYRNNTPAVRAPGVAHLMTGRNLDGDTAGIAFIDSLCAAREGVSLSDSLEGEFYSALIMAHELGHNFGARHDGVAGSVCASTPQNYIMAPAINGSSQFSQCSLDSMAPTIARARGTCIGAATYADLSVEVPASPFNVDTSSTFSLPITVRSVGSISATNARLEVQLPQELAFQSATVAGGSCSATGMLVTCTLGALAAAEERAVDLRLTGSVLGSFFVQAKVSASNDFLVGNNTGSVQVGLQSAVDLGVAISATPSSIFVTDAVDVNVDVSSLRTQAARGGTMYIQLGGIPVESISAGPHTCSVDALQPSVVFCRLADVPSHTTTRIAVRGRADRDSFYQITANVSLPNDGDYSNNYAFTEVSVRAEREVLTRVSTENLRAVIGTAHDIIYTITTAGRLPSTNVNFTFNPPSNGVVESFVASAGTCTPVVSQAPSSCSFGTLNPGDIRTVTVRVRLMTAGTTTMYGQSTYMIGTFQAYSSVLTWIYTAMRVDAAAYFGSPPIPALEGQTSSGVFGFETSGIDPAQNIVGIIDVPASVRLTSLQILYSPPGWQCELLTQQRGRCTGSFVSVEQRNSLISFSMVSATPIEAEATLAMTADNDGDTTNNSSTTQIRFVPFLDVGVTAASIDKVFTVGEITPVDLTITTGTNPVPSVSLSSSSIAPDYELVSIFVNGADCPLDLPGSFPGAAPACDMGNLPAHASVPVTVNYRALRQNIQGTAYINVATPRDNNSNNNSVQIAYHTVQVTDVQLSIAQTTVTGTSGTRVNYPTITVTNGVGVANDVLVDVPLPTFVNVASVSSTGICSGTATVQCSFGNMQAGSTGTISLALNATAAGTFTSAVALRASNDSVLTNNSGSVDITVTAAPSNGGGGSSGGGSSSGGSSSGGGGGGGGRMEWLALSLLGLLVARRARRAHFQGRLRPVL